MTVIPSLRLMCKNYVQAPNVGALFDQSLDERDAESITKANKKQVRRKKKKAHSTGGSTPQDTKKSGRQARKAVEATAKDGGKRKPLHQIQNQNMPRQVKTQREEKWDT